MATAKKAARKSAPKAPAKEKPKRGNMKPTEIRPLVMAARKAFDIQNSLGNVDGENFDQWRRRECLETVNKPGLTACNHGDYRPLLAHFQTLAGDDSAALANLLKSGQKTDHADPRDTQEERRKIAYVICTRLAEHMYLAESSIDKLIAEGEEQWEANFPGETYPGPHPDWISNVNARKAAIDARGKGPLTPGYLISIVRQKTRRPDLNLGKMWQDGLAERCTVSQLEQILYTVVNRINAVEGIQETAQGRNKKQRNQAKAESQKPLDGRW